ncbi:hypothetical protein SAMN04487895_101780 [Paenibacillus sophorae]|uniref:DNRLRE domain-containing protein n=1 Tax=Paenibacillus sophorae TaxID=1333845 RepID=A0A1H8H787_9BACL|nr:DNRLRE domain-containing protein [Paenibacillus sophorae]QWU14470.1 DNRLRE domain-containing protein [Paenibacillus sophorae]SEN52211.1 hypothetical protein SAMN04487895_101780 [Paenibacillus sophorae]
MDELDEISSIITVKNRLSNQMQGSFTLYRQEDNDLDSSIVIKQSNGDDLRSTITVKVSKDNDINSVIDVVYTKNSDIDGEIEAVAVQYLESYIEVRPHNQMFGKFELMSAPKVTKVLSPIADATTRSREDLHTINYGDTRSMLTGQSIDEEFGAFVQFADFTESIPDLKFIESAKLRLYYTNVTSGANIELHQPNTIWREMGVTDANKPFSTELLSDTFTINTIQRYVEFDVKDIAKRWQDGTLNNYGFIILTPDDTRYTFFTRESDYHPQLIVEYITSQIYSIGRSELESSIFVYGKGSSDISAKLTVDSDVGINNLESYLYVHKQQDFMYGDMIANIQISKPDLFSTMTIQRREFSDLDSSITVGVRSITEVNSAIGISNPYMDSWLTVDPNMSMPSIITVAKPTSEFLEGNITVNCPDFGVILSVSDYTKVQSNIDGKLTVRTSEVEETIDSFITTSQPDMNAYLVIRAIGDSGVDSQIEVPYYDNIDSKIGYSRPQIDATLTVKYTTEAEGYIYVKDKEYLDSIIDVKNISEMSGILMVKAVNQIDGELTVNNPELFGHLSPRVSGDNELTAEILIKKRNVGDLNSYISVRGQGNRNFVIIF